MVSLSLSKKRKIEEKCTAGESACEIQRVSPSEGMFKEMRLRRLVRENHGKPIVQLLFHPNVEKGNLLATIGDNQANIYDNEHGKDHLDILSHFLNITDDGVSAGQLNTCCWISSNDDALLAVGGADKFIHILSIARSQVIVRLEGHSGSIIHLASHPTDTNILLSVSDDKTVRLWNIESARCISIYDVGKVITTAAFHISGEKFLLGTQTGDIYEWPIDLCSMQINKDQGLLLSKKLHSAPVDCIAYIGKDIISKSTNGKIEYWDPTTGKSFKSMSIKSAEGHKSKFDISFDKKFLAVGNSVGQCLIYEIATGKLVHELHAKRAKSPITSCQFSYNCLNIVFCDQDSLVWRFDYVSKDTLEKWDNLKKAAMMKENKEEC